MDPTLIRKARTRIAMGEDVEAVLEDLAQEAYDLGHTDGEEYADNGNG